LRVYYRISDAGYKKPKIATKKHCLLNFLSQWPLEEIEVYADKVNAETKQFLDDYAELTSLNVQYIPEEQGGNAASWRYVKEKALALPDTEVVYFVEDDYLHLDYSRRILLEGIVRADYVSLVDYPDKYIPASRGGNPFIDDSGSEPTRVILTASTHWRLANSTTMTFATKVKTLREDNEIWSKHTSGVHPNDFPCFIELLQKGRSLITPIPSLATHAEPGTLAPLIEWEKV